MQVAFQPAESEGSSRDELLLCHRPRRSPTSARSSPAWRASAASPSMSGLAESVRRVPGALVTGGYYETLGLQPVAGRLLAREDDEPGAPLVAVISDGYWEREHRAQRRRGRADGPASTELPVTIVGVSPRGFVGANVGSIADITMAVAALPQVNASAAPLLGPGNFWLRILARPQPGVSVSQAAARLNAVWPRISGAVIAPHWPASRRKAMAESVFQLRPGGTGWTYLQRHLPEAAARADGRRRVGAADRLRERREPAAGARVGAAERDGGAPGDRRRPGPNRAPAPDREHAAVARSGRRAASGWPAVAGRFLVSLISSGPTELVFDLTPNWHVLGFTSVVAIATGIVFGLVPALQATAAGPAATLKEDARTSTSAVEAASVARHRAGGALADSAVRRRPLRPHAAESSESRSGLQSRGRAARRSRGPPDCRCLRRCSRTCGVSRVCCQRAFPPTRR